ncbi:hypothetical protein V6N11_000297 [Hibiscus sabdariffa]|uniref:Uncharacterized protein n=1 Tax=Hibiscus sabdariffa TaxID=183260 RepID=A0ABR2NFY9_9ROSI
MERPENETKHDDGEQAMEADDLQPNATFLTDLNLLIVALSLTSVCSDEEGFHLDDTQNKDNNNIKGNIPRLKPRKRKTNDHVKLMRRHTHKIQTIPKDFRHCRKM